MSEKKVLLIDQHDDVVIALTDLKKGTKVEGGIVLLEDVPQAHKIARHDMKKGQPVLKYGCPIGILTKDVKKGEWIHTQNLKTNLEETPSYHYVKDLPANEPASAETFLGYVRADGRVGIRDDLYLLPTVGCVNSILAALKDKFVALHPEMKASVKILSHPYGCSQLGDDLSVTRKILTGLGTNPNAGAVLVVGLGCENNRLGDFMKTFPVADPARVISFNCQEHPDEIAYGLEQMEKLYSVIKGDKRTPCPLSKLVLGVKCGGSDGFSGLTANPLLGRVSEVVGSSGGRVGLSEVPEMFGAEQLLMNRAKDEVTFKKIVALIDDFKEYYARNGQVCYENPSPGNKDGGITTLEEKSLGCIQKAGHMEVRDVLNFGEAFKADGLSLVNGPGNDIVASTDLAAAGATILVFTTGRGTPFGSIIPTIKVATNHRLAQNKADWIDFDAEDVFSEGFEPVKERLLALVLKVASGEVRTKSEANGSVEIAIFKQGVTL
jgi:altronate hydrolase